MSGVAGDDAGPEAAPVARDVRSQRDRRRDVGPPRQARADLRHREAGLVAGELPIAAPQDEPHRFARTRVRDHDQSLLVGLLDRDDLGGDVEPEIARERRVAAPPAGVVPVRGVDDARLGQFAGIGIRAGEQRAAPDRRVVGASPVDRIVRVAAEGDAPRQGRARARCRSEPAYPIDDDATHACPCSSPPLRRPACPGEPGAPRLARCRSLPAARGAALRPVERNVRPTHPRTRV